MNDQSESRSRFPDRDVGKISTKSNNLEPFHAGQTVYESELSSVFREFWRTKNNFKKYCVCLNVI